MYMKRYGMTIPLEGVPILEQRDWIQELDSLGYTDLWTSEAGSFDGLTPLALASIWAPNARLGCAILPVYTRAPALLAMSIATLCQAAPGRIVVGLGSSSNVIVENWNGIPFEKPYQHTRDRAMFLRRALTGERLTEDADTPVLANRQRVAACDGKLAVFVIFEAVARNNRILLGDQSNLLAGHDQYAFDDVIDRVVGCRFFGI